MCAVHTDLQSPRTHTLVRPSDFGVRLAVIVNKVETVPQDPYAVLSLQHLAEQQGRAGLPGTPL